MKRTVTKHEATKSLKITPKNHKALCHLAIDQDSNVMEMADRVIAAGLKAVKRDIPATMQAQAS